jgi:predicted flavoprotein YhiN
VILTHTHEDHAGGLEQLLDSGIEIDRVYASGYYNRKEKKHPAVKALKDTGRETVWLLSGDSLPLDGGTLEVLGPLVHDEEKENNNSLVLLATGGASYPKTGSVGDGQRFAQSLGHRLVPYRPGLIGLETRDPKVTRLAGRRFEDGRTKVLDPDGKTLFEYRGEVDCESFGLSGAAIYNAQRFIEHYERERGMGNGELSLEVSFNGSSLAYRGLRPRPLKEAIVTIGGVDTRDIDPRTMQSKIVPGLYFAGEVMDIDGPTGGYNLTLAFATARKAVKSMEKL